MFRYKPQEDTIEKLDPIIVGLLQRLPKSGEVWPEMDRKLWLDLLAGSFRLVYRDTDTASVALITMGAKHG